jgi:hypothetical protein
MHVPVNSGWPVKGVVGKVIGVGLCLTIEPEVMVGALGIATVGGILIVDVEVIDTTLGEVLVDTTGGGTNAVGGGRGTTVVGRVGGITVVGRVGGITVVGKVGGITVVDKVGGITVVDKVEGGSGATAP